MKRCPECSEFKAIEEFCRNRSKKDGRAVYCKPCHNARGKISKAKNGGNRHYHLMQRYQLSAEQVANMIAAQAGLCASCGERPAEQVDHDHKTGRVRGILCDGCNGGIALFDEDIELMERAAAYLNGELDL